MITVTHVKANFQKSAKNNHFNRNCTFFVFTILFDQFTRFFIFLNHISKANKIPLIFCIQNKKNFSAKKSSILEKIIFAKFSKWIAH